MYNKLIHSFLCSFYETLTFTGMSHLRNLANAIELNPIRKVDNVSQAMDMVEK
jgi:hypothetical protein